MVNNIEENFASEICNELGLDEIQTNQILSLSYPTSRYKLGAEIFSSSDGGIKRNKIAEILKMSYDALNEACRKYHPEKIKSRKTRVDELYRNNKDKKYQVNDELADIFLKFDMNGPLTKFLRYIKKEPQTPSQVKKDRGYDGVKLLFKLHEKNYIKKV